MGNKFAAAILFLSLSSAVAQTPSDFEHKYGKPIVSYVVSEHILMSPEYTTDGQVCMMRLHPRPFATNTNYVSPTLPFQELTTVLDQLIPPPIRGKKKEPFNTGAAGGGAEWMSYVYENVELSFVSSFHPEPDSTKKRREFVFSVKPDPATAQSKTQYSMPSDNDFSPSRVSRLEVVKIKWTGRQCAEQ